MASLARRMRHYPFHSSLPPLLPQPPLLLSAPACPSHKIVASKVGATGSLSAPPSSGKSIYLVTGMFQHIYLPLFSCPLPGKGQVPSDVTQFLKSLKSFFSLPSLKNRRQLGLGVAEEI